MPPAIPCRKFASYYSDSYHAAQLAAIHLLERGFRNYAFVGIADRIWSKRRRDSFVKHIKQAGYETHIYEPPKNKHDREWGREQKFMAEWLRSLPKPIGLMACNDDRGRDVLEACRAADLGVPEEVAVIGVDNDSLVVRIGQSALVQRGAQRRARRIRSGGLAGSIDVRPGNRPGADRGRTPASSHAQID